MILIIKINKDPLHDLEFVKPIENISRRKAKSVHYKKLIKSDLLRATQIIIAGTSLQDDDFQNYLDKFAWIKTIEKPIFGICAGAQIIASVFGAEIKQETEIGYYHENFTKDFLGLKDKQEVYHLHNNYTTLPEGFEKYTDSKLTQAIKHKEKPIYATLFHPEVRNKEMIINFVKRN